MTRSELFDVFAQFEKRHVQIVEIRLHPEQGAGFIHDPLVFDRITDPYLDRAEVGDGMVWGARCFFDEAVPWHHAIVIYETGTPPEREAETVKLDTNRDVTKDALRLRLAEVYAHAAFDRHTSFTTGMDYLPGTETYELGWYIGCLDPECGKTWHFTEDEVAMSGRLELTDRFGWGALCERLSREPARERPIAWLKLGELFKD